MKNYRDPTPALQKDRLPLREKIMAAIVVALIVAAVAVSVLLK